jgi:hypothetical protein
MRWRRIAFWLSFGILAVIVLALTWLWTADLGVFKPQVERFVTEKTGREFAIDGNFYVDLAASSSVIAEDVRFGNAAWADDTDMVRVGRVEIRIDLWSLVRGPIIFELIDIDDADIQLLHPEGQDPNWVLPIEQASPDEGPSPGLDLLFEQIYVDRVVLNLDSHERDQPLELQLNTVRQQQRADGMLDVNISAALGGKIVKLEGEVGTRQALLAGKDVQFDVDVVLDTFELTGSGYIDDLVNPVRPEFEFTAVGPDIDDLTRLLGLGEEGSGDIAISGSLQKITDDRLLLEANGNIGETKIQSHGMVTDLRSMKDIDFDLTASGPDLGRILRLAGIHQVREAPFMIRLNARTEGNTFTIHEGNMVFGEAQIDISGRMPNFPSVDDAVIKLLIEGPDIARFRYVTGLPGAAEGAFKLGFTIDVTDDGVEVLQLDIETALGEIRGTGRLGKPPEFFSSQAELRIKSDSLERVATAYGVEGMPDYPFEIRGAAEYVEGALRSTEPLTATVGNVTATLDGLLALAQGVRGSGVAFTLKGPNLSELIGAFVEAEGVPGEAYDLGGRLEVRDDGFRFRHVQGTVGTSAVSVDGLLTTRHGLDGTRFEFAAGGPAFEEVIEDLVDLEVREGPYNLSGKIALAPDLVRFEDIELDRNTGHISLDLDLGLPVSERRIKYNTRVRGTDVRMILASIGPLEFKELPVSVDARGEVNGESLRFETFEVDIGGTTTSSQGHLEFAEDGDVSELVWSGNIPSLARLATLDGREFRDQAFSWSAHLAGRDGVLRVDDMSVKLGDSDASGTIHFDGNGIPELKVNVQSDSLVFAPLLEKEEFEYDPEPEFEDGKFIPDVAVPFEAMKKLNASIDIDIKELQRDTLFMKNIELDAYLRDGALEISKAGFEARSGAMLARARLEPAEGSGAASIELIARQFALGISQLNMDLAMTGDIDINLKSTGANLRDLLGNANGEVFLNARGGRMANSRMMHALWGDLLEGILNTINPFRESDPFTDFDCIVVPMQIDDGQVAGAPNSFIGTDKLRIVTRSSINMKTEEIRIGIRTTPRRALSVSAGELVNPYVQVVGTLAAPRLAVDEAGVLIGAAVATAGLSVLARGIWDRVSRSRTPCKDTSDQALEELGDRLPDLAIEGLERIE